MLVLSSQATKFGLGASNLDVPEAQNSEIMLPGPENVVKSPKIQKFQKQQKQMQIRQPSDFQS